MEPLESDGRVGVLGDETNVVGWLKKITKKRIPILEWLPAYDWRENFLSDVISGCTVACIHIPQGLAFAMLANVDPIFGLYTACFSTLVYTIFGTAQVGSFGPVAVASMLIGEAILEMTNSSSYSNNELGTALTFVIGVYYLIAFFLRLGVLSKVFTKPFTSGFICGCAVHIIVKSAKLLLGVKIKSEYGILNLFKNIRLVIASVPDTNIPTLIISVVVLIILTLNILIFKPFVRRYTRVVVPVEAMVLVIAALLSYIFEFDKMGVPTIGDIPVGLPSIRPPPFNAMLEVWGPALLIAAINYSTTTSMTIVFNKDLRADQDLLALAMSNIVCSNIQCISIGNSMMRTVIAVTLGIKTLVSSIVSSIVLFFVILFAGPLFSPLPDCILGSVIMIGIVMLTIARLREAPAIFKSSFENAFIWSVTLWFVLIVDIQFGLIAGATLSLRQILSSMSPKKQPPTEGNLIKIETTNPPASK